MVTVDNRIQLTLFGLLSNIYSTLLISTLGQDANRKEFRSLAPCEWLQCEVIIFSFSYNFIHFFCW